MKMSKIQLVGSFLVLMILVFVSCSSKDEIESQSKTEVTQVESKTVEIDEKLLEYDGVLKFINEENEFEVAYNDIYIMTAQTLDVKSVSSTGEEFNNTVVGVALESILSSHGLSKQDYTGIRFTAGDGYAVTVPAEVFINKAVLLAYNFDGELLDESQLPLRVAINDVRSMYYVSNLVSIELIKEEVIGTSEASNASQIVMLETITGTLDKEELVYLDSNDMAVKIADILEIVPATGSRVKFVAADGLAKEESIDVVTEGFIKTTGEDVPLFTGLDLPIGMNIKYVLTMAIGDTTFVSIASAIEVNEMMTIGDDEGVKLSEVIELTSLKGDFYVLTAADGYSVEVRADSTKDAIVYVSENGTTTVQFDNQYPKNTTVMKLLSIMVGDGSQTKMVSEEPTVAKEVSEDLWVITIDGLSDGSFDFNNDKAERMLDLIAVHTNRSKNDVVTEEDWEGYKVNDVLAFLRVEDYKSITITASDGYEIELMKEQVDDETILAVTLNGEALSASDNMVQLVQNTIFATTWIQGVTSITVNN